MATTATLWAGAGRIFSLGMVLLTYRSFDQPATLNANLLGSLPAGTPLGNGSATSTTALGSGMKLTMLAEYFETAGVVKPRGLYAAIQGVVIGHRWRPVLGTAAQAGRQLRYVAVLEHTWLLLGMPVFKQTQEYTGATLPYYFRQLKVKKSSGQPIG